MTKLLSTSKAVASLLFLVGSSLSTVASTRSRDYVNTDLWTGGEGGYVCYRLPNLIELSTPGHLVAFGQGRTGDGCPDSGPMDALVRRSYDNGRSWSAPQLVYANAERQTMGTPTAIVDPVDDTIFVFVNPQHGGRDAAGGRRVLLLNSTDGGRSWSPPRDLTKPLVPPNWSNVWMGTQQGLALDRGNGTRPRLMMCANHHGVGDGGNGAHTVYSDDGGATWANGATLDIGMGFGVGECALAQTPVSAGIDTGASTVVTMYGRVVYDNANISASRRVVAFSSDLGLTFSEANTSAFPGNPGADAEGAFVQNSGTFLVGSAWGQPSPSNPGRHNYTVLVSHADARGRPSSWSRLPGADPLWPGVQAEYSTMLVSRADGNRSFFVLAERGNLYGQEPTQPRSSLRLVQLPFPESVHSAQ
eukprot:g2670.t1